MKRKPVDLPPIDATLSSGVERWEQAGFADRIFEHRIVCFYIYLILSDGSTEQGGGHRFLSFSKL